MKAGFYYHVEALNDGPSVRVPAHLGLFLDALASEAGEVTFFGHTGADAGDADHVLSDNVTFVDLGGRASFPRRTFAPGEALALYRRRVRDVDAMLVRGPSPLLPHLIRASGPVPVAVYLQGDYRTGTTSSGMPAWRRLAIRAWKSVYERQQTRALRSARVIVNSPALARSLPRDLGARVIPSSLVTPEAIAIAPVVGSAVEERALRLAYAGRIVEEKGLLDLIDALALLAARDISVQLDLIGSGANDGFEGTLRARIAAAGLTHRIRFYGYVPTGRALTAALRESDIFVLPSHHEGLPHVLFEAMCAGLPVIATAVGGVPDLVRHREEAYLVDPHRVDQLADAVDLLARDAALRARIASNGWSWAKGWTLQRTCAEVVSELSAMTRADPGG